MENNSQTNEDIALVLLSLKDDICTIYGRRES